MRWEAIWHPARLRAQRQLRRTWLRRRLFVFTVITEMFRVSNNCIKVHAGRLDQSGYWGTFNSLITITFLVLATFFLRLFLLFCCCCLEREGQQVKQSRQDQNNNTELKKKKKKLFIFFRWNAILAIFPIKCREHDILEGIDFSQQTSCNINDKIKRNLQTEEKQPTRQVQPERHQPRWWSALSLG